MAATLPAGTGLLGFKQKSPFALHDAVLIGLPYALLSRFMKESGLPTQAVYDVLRIPARTLARRKLSGRLSTEESGHLERLARLFKTTSEFFNGDPKAAADWLVHPRPIFGNRKPIDLAKTEIGTRQVETLLYQLDYGIVV